MRLYAPLLAAALLLLPLAILSRRGPLPDRDTEQSLAPRPAASSHGLLSPGPDLEPLAPSSAPASVPPDESDFTASRAETVATITAAYTRYEAAALPRIEPYLRHEDAEIRAYARQAIVQLGHGEGADTLRRASRLVTDPREAVALLDAAEFLDLPPAAPLRPSPR